MKSKKMPTQIPCKKRQDAGEFCLWVLCLLRLSLGCLALYPGYLAVDVPVPFDFRCQIYRLWQLCEDVPGCLFPSCILVYGNVRRCIVSHYQCAGVYRSLCLTLGIKGSNLYRTVFFMPNLIGGIVLGYIWSMIFDGILGH